MKPLTGYLATHFFNDATFQWTENLATILEERTGIDLYVPQRNAAINDKKGHDQSITDIAIARADTKALRKAQVLIACLDGLSIDEGVAAEIMGHATMAEYEAEDPRAPRRLLIGIITDMRYQGSGENKLYRNQFVVGKVKEAGHLVVGYPGSEDYIEEVIRLIEEFQPS